MLNNKHRLFIRQISYQLTESTHKLTFAETVVNILLQIWKTSKEIHFNKL